MKAKPIPEELKDLLDYNPENGDLRWTKSINSMAQKGDMAGTTDSYGYRVLQYNGSQYKVHRVVWFLHYGYQTGSHIDHIDGNPGNNIIKNLREADFNANNRNKKLDQRNKTGISGVRKRTERTSYEVTIGKKNYIGSYEDFFEACCARKSAENKYGFHENHGRIE
jgi:hypothetical protein